MGESFMERRIRLALLGRVVAATLLAGLGCGVDQGGLKEIEQKDITRDAAVSDLLVRTDVPGTGGLIGTSTGGAGQPIATGSGGIPSTDGEAGNGGGVGAGGSDASGGGGNDVTGSGGVIGTGGAGSGDAAGADGLAGQSGLGGDNGAGGSGAGVGGSTGGGQGTGGSSPGSGGHAGGSGGMSTSPGGKGGGGHAGAGGAGGGAGYGGGGGAAGGATAVGCDAKSCPNGCCSGRVCVQAPTARLCGRGGGTCQACGGCQRCSPGGACELDPQSHWQMTAVSAMVNPHAPNFNGQWDPMGQKSGGPLPDPFAQFEMPVGNPIGWTSTLIDTTAPMWAEPLVPPGTAVPAGDLLPGGMQWQIWLGDEDANQQADVICELNGPITAADFAAGGFTRMNVGSCSSVKIGLMCVP